MHYYHANSHSLATQLFTPYSCSFMGIKSAISVSLVFNFTDEGPGLDQNVWNLIQVMASVVLICENLATQKCFTQY